MIMMMMMMMTMMTNTIPYRRTKTHIWDKVLMGIWVHPVMTMMTMMTTMMTMMMSSFELCSSAEISGDPQGFPLSLHSEDPFYAVTVEEYLPDDLLRIRRAIRKISK